MHKEQCIGPSCQLSPDIIKEKTETKQLTQTWEMQWFPSKEQERHLQICTSKLGTCRTLEMRISLRGPCHLGLAEIREAREQKRLCCWGGVEDIWRHNWEACVWTAENPPPDPSLHVGSLSLCKHWRDNFSRVGIIAIVFMIGKSEIRDPEELARGTTVSVF